MAVKTNQYASRIAQDTARGPSNGIWFDCPLEDFIQNFGGGVGTAGYLVQDDFCPVASPSSTAAIGTLGQWALWSAATSTVLDGVEEGGVVAIGNSGTATKSLILTSNAGMFRMIGGSTAFNYTGGKLWFECRLALGSIAAAQSSIFIGLADNTTTQINASDTAILTNGTTLATVKNTFGFWKQQTSNPGDFGVAFCPAGGPVVSPTGLQTLVTTVTGSAPTAYAASTDKGHGTGFFKLGFVFDPTPSSPPIPAPASPPAGQTAGVVYKPLIQFFVNGQLHPQFLNPGIAQAVTFPVNTVFAPVINVMNIQSGGQVNNVYIDWIRIAQLASF